MIQTGHQLMGSQKGQGRSGEVPILLETMNKYMEVSGGVKKVDITQKMDNLNILVSSGRQNS